MGPRAIISLIRAAVYGGLGTMLGLERETIDQLLIPAIAGAVTADIVTWFIRSIILFPHFFKHGLLDAIVNIAFGWFFLAVFGLGVTFENGEAMAVGFLAGLLVVALKATYYALDFLEEDMDEG